MRNYRLLFLLSLAFLIILSACNSDDSEQGQAEKYKEKNESTTWDKVQKEGKIVVGTSGTLFPSSYHPADSDKITGYDVETMREIGKKLGVEIEFEEIGYDAMFAALNSGRIDAAINDIAITDERKKKYAFSDPYKYSYTTMIVREEDLSGIETLEDLKGKKAGGAATTTYSKIAEHYGAEVKTYGNATNDVYLRDVDNGRTDVVINDYYLQSLALKAMPQFDITLHPHIRVHSSQAGIVLRKDDTALQQQINDALAELHEDETLTGISKEFFGGKDASKKPQEEITEIEGIDF
ncbi:transporter substrate-binding domain-containing protein [Pontibacillus litoralis]|uniref:ABC transporter substrate-binding protein n=1 Tax=Pontibacillus litoralis JSM 072002 TaxID=1385512 RepID=A0A0A5G3U7_9BACI|nr:transporter substrate-binding domain-containing protein [Pontibacillus litoralis]KGX85765.1 ABC transporter substrate-binding protein [Pontibacillus litoralis JSM 072002]